MTTVTVRKLMIATAAAGALFIAAFLYFTRPISAPTASTPTASPRVDIAQGQNVYRVDPAASKATFRLNEVLSGQPFEVVGETNQVAADIALDPAHPAESRIGTVKVNARTLKTDSTRRDSAIGRFILKSEDPAMEYVVFEPKVLEGMPEKIERGTAFSFRVQGNLTIAGVTKEQLFEGTATLQADETLKGEAEVTVNRGDYNLVIPSVPFVANVDERVKLKIEFVARPF